MIFTLYRFRLHGFVNINILNDSFNHYFSIIGAFQYFNYGLIELIEKSLNHIVCCTRCNGRSYLGAFSLIGIGSTHYTSLKIVLSGASSRLRVAYPFLCNITSFAAKATKT